MPITTTRTRQAKPEDSMDPFAPDGTWQAEWPPEVWLVKWRLQAIGIRPKRKAVLDAITEAARQLYVKRYGYEPVRRDRRRDHYTIVFEHDRVEVIDEAALMVLWHPYERKETQP